MFLQSIWWLVVTCLSEQISECLKLDNPLEGSAYIIPESPVIENGSQIQASCILSESFVIEHGVDANQIFWKLKENRIPKEHYTTVNSTVSNVTLTFSTVGVALLTCNIQYNEDHVGTVFGIQVTSGLFPEKPKNLTCITYYNRNMTCSWDPGKKTYLPTHYSFKLSIKPGAVDRYELQDGVNNCYAILFPYIHYFVLNSISVEASNSLGTVISDPINLDPVDVIKPDPPEITLINQVPGMSRVLTVNWKNPSLPVTYGLKYNLRYRILYTNEWIQVPSEDTNLKRSSFLVQGLKPFTPYSFSIRCKNIGNSGYWSEWSAEKIKKTPETYPSRGPPIWRKIKNLAFPNREIRIMWKELDKSDANGIILGYQLKIMQKDSSEVHIVNTTDLEYRTILSQSGYEISLIAINSAGSSPMSVLIVPDTRESDAARPTDFLQHFVGIALDFQHLFRISCVYRNNDQKCFGSMISSLPAYPAYKLILSCGKSQARSFLNC